MIDLKYAKRKSIASLLTGTPGSLATMPFRCPACHHFSDQPGHFVAHMKPRKFNCKGWDLLTDAEKDPDSNCITKQA